MANQLYTGVMGTATVTGTVAYTGIANVTGYRPWSSVADGDAVDALVKSGLNTWEYVKLTKSGGSTPVLTRTAIRRQSDGSSNAVSWPTNSTVEIYSSVGAENIAALDSENTFLQDQVFNGKKIYLDVAKTCYLQSTVDNEFVIYVNNTQFARLWLESGKPTFRLTWSDSGATGGPDCDLYRNSSSPAVNDTNGRVRFLGKNSADTVKVYGQIESYIVDPTSGSEDGDLTISVLKNGTLRQMAWFDSAGIFFNPLGLSYYAYFQKNTSGINVPGLEVTDRLYITYANTAPVVVNRTGSDGTLIEFCRDGGVQGSIGVASGVVSLTGACLTHPSEWAAGEVEPEDLRGLVVRAADGVLADDSGAHPLVRVTRQSGDPAVYGVITGRMAWTLADGSEIQALQVAASGTAMIRVVGTVRIGDLLESSPVPGCAWAQRDDVVRARTVAKATQGSDDTGEPRLVACTVMAGG